MTSDVLIIIRSVGERTTELCYQIACQQVPKEDIIIIEERPFSHAVKKTFELGANSRKKWTLALDADILLFEDTVEKMVAQAEKLSNDYFTYQGGVIDKIFCGTRGGGPHLYRSSLLKKAIAFIPESEEHLRPESATYKKMAEIGYHYYQSAEIYGLHDFLQYKKDLYRKCVVHTQKHFYYIEQFISLWKKMAAKDEDYKVMLLGIFDGLLMDSVRQNLINNQDFAESRLDFYEMLEHEPTTLNNNELREYLKNQIKFYESLSSISSPYLITKDSKKLNTKDIFGIAQFKKKLGHKLKFISERLLSNS